MGRQRTRRTRRGCVGLPETNVMRPVACITLVFVPARWSVPYLRLSCHTEGGGGHLRPGARSVDTDDRGFLACGGRHKTTMTLDIPGHAPGSSGGWDSGADGGTPLRRREEQSSQGVRAQIGVRLRSEDVGAP